jgi:hypothetical protein
MDVKILKGPIGQGSLWSAKLHYVVGEAAYVGLEFRWPVDMKPNVSFEFGFPFQVCNRPKAS